VTEQPPTAKPSLDLQLDLEIDEPFVDLVDTSLLYRAVERALLVEGIADAVEITLVVTDDEEIRSLNDAHRGIDEATDVLSFPLESAPLDEDSPAGPLFITPPGAIRHLGDVVVSLPRAEMQARDYGHSLRRELAYLTVHGCLHLLGYDHESESEREEMRGKEEAALVEVPRES
jgi:probable rRNA maturation factor